MSKTASVSAPGFPLFSLALMLGLVMRYAVTPGTTWNGIDVHYAGGILIVVSLIPLAFVLTIAFVVLGLVAFVKGADRRRARRYRQRRLGR